MKKSDSNELVFLPLGGSNEVGMNLYLSSVQVLKLVEYTGGDAPDGFEAEDGYQADQPPPKEEFPGDDDKGDGAPPVDRKAKQEGLPDTESAVTPDLLEDA